jgi:hypothetical protein
VKLTLTRLARSTSLPGCQVNDRRFPGAHSVTVPQTLALTTRLHNLSIDERQRRLSAKHAEFAHGPSAADVSGEQLERLMWTEFNHDLVADRRHISHSVFLASGACP